MTMYILQLVNVGVRGVERFHINDARNVFYAFLHHAILIRYILPSLNADCCLSPNEEGDNSAKSPSTQTSFFSIAQ
jgi:hypothetical protein